MSCAPPCCLSDLASTEVPAGINAEIGDAQQSGQCVYRSGALCGEFVAGSEEDSCRGAHAIVLPRGAQLFDGQRKESGGDPARVEWVGLSDTVSTSVHPGGLGNLVSGVGRIAGQLRPVAPGAFDDTSVSATPPERHPAQTIARERSAGVFGNVSVPRCLPSAASTA